MKKEDNSFGVASIILGILSIVFASINGIIFGIIALVFASKQQKRAPNAWGRRGKVLAIIGIVLSLILTVILLTNPGLLQQLGGQYGTT